jgi:ketosteroid isomerase-like protein
MKQKSIPTRTINSWGDLSSRTIRRDEEVASMKMKLPASIEAYFDAVNRGDLDGMLLPFAANAVVKDEGRTRTGRSAVRAWIEEVTEKYHPSFQVEGGTEEGGGATTVHVLVSGTFPNSPVRLRYAFKLRGGKITHLEIS